MDTAVGKTVSDIHVDERAQQSILDDIGVFIISVPNAKSIHRKVAV